VSNVAHEITHRMSGGYPAADDVNRLTVSMSMVGLDGAAGAVTGYDQNVPYDVIHNPNGRTKSNTTVFGEASKGASGALRFHEFRDLLSDAFHFNRVIGCVFVAAFNKRVTLDFFGELYLSYLVYYNTNPLQYDTPKKLNDALFDAQNQYSLFKQFIVHPNLKYNGYCGFPLELGAQRQVAETWLKF
jgi:hypothetical protein